MPRVYLPMTWAQLAELHAQARVPDGVERVLPAGDDEESEYDALQDAADRSAELLDGPGRRVVVVAEVARPDDDVPLSRVAAVHVDDVAHEASALAQDPPELGWWATQEIAELLRLDS